MLPRRWEIVDKKYNSPGDVENDGIQDQGADDAFLQVQILSFPILKWRDFLKKKTEKRKVAWD